MFRAILRGGLQLLMALLMLALFVFSLIAFTVAVIWHTDSKLKYAVDARKVPDGFPILVVTPGKEKGKWKARVVCKGNLDDYLKDHPDYTYLVPDGLDESLRSAIQSKSRSPDGQGGAFDSDWYSDFRVERLAGGQQLLEVRHEASEDYVNVGWYEATDKAITPKYYKRYFGPALAFYAMPRGFVITIVVWALGIFAYVMIVRRRRNRRT